MSGFEAACRLLPPEIRRAAQRLSPDIRAKAQEFRLRLDRKPRLTMQEGDIVLDGLRPVTTADLARVLEIAEHASPYASEAAIRQGYVCADGGVRVGLCGRVRSGAEGVWAQTHLTSLSIRIPREVRGCASPFCRAPFRSTLILSPPGGGKTTLLRDMVRLLSDGGLRVCLCDERGEVAAPGTFGFGFDVGERTDVLSERPKNAAAMQLLRTMNPQVLAMDEITAREDADACLEAADSGVELLATVHAADRDELCRSGRCRELLDRGVFERYICIVRTPSGREYREGCF